jgi:hypothetical protein
LPCSLLVASLGQRLPFHTLPATPRRQERRQ